MKSRNMRVILTILLSLFVMSAWAGNRTISGVFDGTEMTMAASPDSCNGTAKRYREIGTIQVSSSGSYTFVDGGNDFAYYGLDADIADIVVMVYEGSFNAASPSTNRIAFVDTSNPVALDAGTSYVLVVQHWCDEIRGPFAAIIIGSGDITGAGFGTFAYTFGVFSGEAPSADFNDLGVRRYSASAPMTVPRSGNYFFGDIGPPSGGGFVELRVYQSSFDPNNTAANLVAQTFGNLNVALSLQAGVTYVFVAVDVFDLQTGWQFILFPPGTLGFNQGLTGAWVIEGIPAQGIMAEIFPDTRVLFFAWFTFQDQLLVTQASTNATAAAGGEGATTKQSTLLSADQRWTTAFGALPAEGATFMNIKYENSTGGYFYQSEPAATTDSNYGSGWIELKACDRMTVHWEFPGGIEGTDDFIKLLPDGLDYCQSFVKAAPIAPLF